MVHKPKISRKKKKKIKVKKTFVKKDVFEDETSLTPSIGSPQNIESPESTFDEEIKPSEELIAPHKDEKNNFSISYPKKYLLFEIVSLLLLTVIVYGGTLNHTFHFDDKSNISGNPSIQISNISVDELVKADTASKTPKRPVANISFALNYYFHGLDVKGFHVVNIIIHLLAGIMLYFFVKKTLNIPLVRDRLGEASFIPFFTALIWLVHPLHTQSVTYIVQRMNSMASMFFIMAMLFYVKGRLTPERVKKILFFIISFGAAILAFGSKQNTATLPLFILLYEWYFFQDLRIKISRKQFFLVTALGGTFAFIFYYYLGSSPFERLFFPGYGGRPFTMPQRLLTQPRVVLHYISLLLYPEPSRLNLDYDFPLSYTLFSPATTFFSILVIIGLLGMAIYTAKENRLYSFCILWFLGNLVIESSTIPLEVIFEHRTYLPSMMVICLLVIIFHRFIVKKKILIACLVTVALLFSYWTYARNKVWQDELTLLADIYKKSPNKARVNNDYGTALIAVGRSNEALPILEKALQLYEKEIEYQKSGFDYGMSIINLNLGVLYQTKGEYHKAIFYLNKSLKHFYMSLSAHFQIGLCYSQIGRYEEAVYHLTKAKEFTKHSQKQYGRHSSVAQIEKSLKVAKMALERQKNRFQQGTKQ